MSVGNQCVVLTIEIVACTGDAPIVDAVGEQEVTIQVDLYFDCVLDIVKQVVSQAISFLVVDWTVLPLAPVAEATVGSSSSSPRRKSGFLFLLTIWLVPGRSFGKVCVIRWVCKTNYHTDGWQTPCYWNLRITTEKLELESIKGGTHSFHDIYTVNITI